MRTAEGCAEQEEFLALHASGDLEPAEAAALRRHLDGCPGCRAALDSHHATFDWLHGHRAAPVAAPMLEELQRRLAERLPAHRPAPWLLAWLGRIRESVRGHGEPVLAIAGTALLALGALAALATGGPTGGAVATDPGAMRTGAGLATAAAGTDDAEDRLRIEMQTGDPNVRIIWFAAVTPGPR